MPIEKVGHLCTFQKDDATALSFPDESFDVVFCGNVTSLVSNRDKALAEYARVLKPGGLLPLFQCTISKNQATNWSMMYARLSVLISLHSTVKTGKCFQNFSFCHFESINFCFDELPAATVDAFCKTILERPHLQSLPVLHSRGL